MYERYLAISAPSGKKDIYAVDLTWIHPEAPGRDVARGYNIRRRNDLFAQEAEAGALTGRGNIIRSANNTELLPPCQLRQTKHPARRSGSIAIPASEDPRPHPTATVSFHCLSNNETAFCNIRGRSVGSGKVGVIELEAQLM